MKSPTFIDTVRLHAAAGNGGNGSASFRREKFVPRGGPDGGDGGRGGHVILRGNRNESSLIRIYYAPHQRAEHAGHGKGRRLHGKNGSDLIVDVPRGTEARDANTGALVGDITRHDEELIIAHGGRGGLGNCHWKSSTNRAPTEQTDGDPGEKVELSLTLKIIANVGLVGYPNAGKSSLLGVVTDAHPKVGAYPFTTLTPTIGTLVFEDYTRGTIADIPGLIDGAHDGIGLGHAFLRHIERASCLVYVLDMAGIEGRKPHEDYQSLCRELELHSAGMTQRPSLVVANKMDLPEAAENLDEFKRETGSDPIPVSAHSGEGMEQLKAAIRTLLPADSDAD